MSPRPARTVEEKEMTHTLGKTLLIANPAAQNGKGAKAALFAEERLRSVLPQADFVAKMTEAPRHGLEIAAKSAFFDTVVALGGDGIVHEVANGLMSLPQPKRPHFGVLPVGSGNDYAKTLGMSLRIEESVEQLLRSRPRAFDVGLCNGEYFVETLSFGLDAAIALDTVQRRVKTGRKGAWLFFASGVDMLLHHLHTYEYALRYGEVTGGQAAGAGSAVVDAATRGKAAATGEVTAASGPDRRTSERRGQMLLFAVQIGRTYGGGFTICPKAATDDGLFDLCIAHPPMGIPKALLIFALAKNAHHTGFKQLEFLTTDTLTLHFPDKVPPVQIDGEAFEGETFDIRCIPQALHVLVPDNSRGQVP